MKKTIAFLILPLAALVLVAAGTQKSGPVTTSQFARTLLTNETADGFKATLGVTAGNDLASVSEAFDLKYSSNALNADPVNQQQLKTVKAKIYNNQKITLSFLGDSVGEDVQPVVESALLPWFGRAGAVSTSNPYYLGNYFYLSASGTYSYWSDGRYLTNGSSGPGIFWGGFVSLGDGGSVQCLSSVSNGIAADSVGVAWYKNSAFGTMLVQTQQVSGSWGTLTTISGAGSSGLTMDTTNIAVPFANNYLMRVVSTGTNIPVSLALRDTRSGRGFISSATATPGQAPLEHMRNMGSNNVATYLLWQNPDAIFYKAERLTTDSTNLSWFNTILTNTIPSCDLVLLAHHASYNASDSSGVRDLFLSEAKRTGRAFVDVYAQSLPFSNSVAAGLYQSDQVHLQNVGRAVLNSQVPAQLGLGVTELTALTRTWPSTAAASDPLKAGLGDDNVFTGENTFNDYVNSRAGLSARAGTAVGVWNEADDQQTVWRRFGNSLVWQDSVSLYATIMSLTNDGGVVLFDLPYSFGAPRHGWASPMRYAAADIAISSNSPSAWPAAPLRNGDSLIVNSNGVLYLLKSVGSAWVSTNIISTTDTGDAAIAAAAVLVTGNGSITSTNFNGAAPGLSNVYAYRATLGGDGENVNPYVVLNATNQSTPPELLYRPGSVSGGAENNIVSFTRIKRGVAPRGVSTWNYFGADTNTFTGQSVTNLIYRMSTNGMVRWGNNDLTLDEGISFRGNGIATNNYPAAVPFGYSYDENRIWRADTNRFPGGLKAIVDCAHANGIKVHLYCSPALFGSAGYWMPFGSNHVDMVNNVSNLAIHVGVDGFKFEQGYSGSLHEFVNEAVRWGKPVWINVPADNGYEPQFADTVNAWRVGTGLFGDINGMPSRLYQWADIANFSMIRPGHVPDFDLLYSHSAYRAIPNLNGYGTNSTGTINILALSAMANANIWHGRVAAYEGEAARYDSFYEDYNNPLINAIQADFTKPMWKQSSNYLAVAYGKWLEDGSVAVLIQNRSDTNKTEVIEFDDYFGNHAPAMSQSTNHNVCTVRDIMQNVTLGYYTNSYSVSVGPTNIAWLKITKGIVEHFAPGTNYLSDYGWMSLTNYPDNDPGMTVNYTYYPWQNKIFINSTLYDHGFYSAYGNFVRLKYALNKQADYFSGKLWTRFNGANTGVNIYTNDVLATTVLMPTSGSISNLFVSLTNADTMMIEVTNATANLAFTLAEPLVYCRGQTKVDEQGRQIRLLDKSYVDSAFTAAATPVLAGDGLNITNIGENIMFFDSIPVASFSRLSPSSPGPAPSTLQSGFSGTGAAARRAYIWVPGWVTNATFYGMVIQASAVSTWTNYIEPSFQASDGRFVGSGSGLNASNEVCMITAANAVSNYTFTVKWPATNVNWKGFLMSFLAATNTSATHYIGPVMKVRYNP